MNGGGSKRCAVRWSLTAVSSRQRRARYHYPTLALQLHFSRQCTFLPYRFSAWRG